MHTDYVVLSSQEDDVMNLTLSVDEKVVNRARSTARAMGKSLNQVIREYLEHLTGQEDTEKVVEELKALSVESRGHSRGWCFDRDEIHERS